MSRTAPRRPGGRLAAVLVTLCAATVPALPAVAATTPAAAPAASPTTSPSTSPTAADPASDPLATAPDTPPKVVDRTVTDKRITESSGLVTSRTLDGVLWTFNDSGGTPDLFGIGRSGKVVARLRVTGGATDRDWEAAAPVRLLSGDPAIAVGDIGDNRSAHPSVTLYVVREPSKAGVTKAPPVRTLTLTYPDRPSDAECLVADPRTNRLYVVTKGLLGGRLYAVPPQVWPGGRKDGPTATGTLEYLGRVPLVLVTDGVGLPDGRVALRTYGELAMMPPVPAGGGDVLWKPLATTVLPRQGQGEGLAVNRTRTAFFLSTEGADKPVLRFVPPAAVLAARPPVTATPTPSAGRSSAAGGVTPATREAVGRTFAVAGGVGAGVVLVGAGALALVRRRRG